MKDIIVKKPVKQIKALPYPFYRLALLILALLGLADSVYLAVQHYQVHTDMTHRSFCAISKSINCDTVSQSVYSIFFGVPFAFWGCIAYIFMLVMVILVKDRSEKSVRIWTFIFLASWVFVAYSIALAIVSTFFVKSYCIMCIGTYIINGLLLYLSWLTVRRFTKIGMINEIWQIFRYLAFFKKPMFPILVIFGAIAICMMLFFPPYWRSEPPTLSPDIPHGITETGHPWIGAEEPTLTIIEYTDYQCFQCRKLHYFLRQLVNQYPDKLRLVHINFPMDDAINPLVGEPYHVGSAVLAMVTEYALLDDNFWEVNDLIFNMIAEGKTSFSGEDLAEVTGIPLDKINQIVQHPYFINKIYADVIKGIEIGVTGTPSYVIDGVLYEADIPPDILHRLTGE